MGFLHSPAVGVHMVVLRRPLVWNVGLDRHHTLDEVEVLRRGHVLVREVLGVVDHPRVS